MYKKLTAVFLMFFTFVSAAYAGYWIYSNVVSVSVSNYTLTLAEFHDGYAINLHGRLTDPGGTGVPSVSIEIYQTDVSGNIITPIGSTTTNATGYFSIDHMAVSDGMYYFKGGYFVP
jgi:protocatechuate 3,4-dioxygenase beta subunit